MEQTLGEFQLLKALCHDMEKESFLAQHATLKTPYIVQVLKTNNLQEVHLNKGNLVDDLVTLDNVQFEGSKIYSIKKLAVDLELKSLKDYVLSRRDFLDEAKICEILQSIASNLKNYYQSQRSKSFGLQLENCFIDSQDRIVLVDHASPAWRDFLNEQNQRSNIEDCSIVSFGKLAYFLMTKQWPEGYFELPSSTNPKLDKKWDDFVKALMHHRPTLRTSSFFEIVSHLNKLKEHPVSLKPLIKQAVLEKPEFEPNPGHVFQQELVVGKYLPQEKSEKVVEPLLTDMVVIPSGEYSRGSTSGARDEMPKHKIQLSAFALDIHPVTNEQYVRFLEAMDGEKDAQNNDMIKLKDSRIKKVAGRFVIESGYSKHPVVGISWYGAAAYAKWVGKRLPTEAEWEIAASSLVEDAFPTGQSIEKGMANFFYSDTQPVMSYKPSSLGLYDMAGNVYEWCHDWYGYNYYETSIQEPINPQGPVQGVYRVLRGGCWKSLKDDLRVSHRHRNNPFAANSTYGFRCAADVV